MKAPRSLLVAAVLLSAFGAGWLSAPPATPSSAISGRSTPAFAHPGRVLSAAAYRLTGRSPHVVEPDLKANGESRADVRTARPDIVTRFRKDVSAVVLGPAGPILIVVAADGQNERGIIREGEVYRDGWTVAAIGDQTVELRRGAQSRIVDLTLPSHAELALEPNDADNIRPTRVKTLTRRQARGDAP